MKQHFIKYYYCLPEPVQARRGSNFDSISFIDYYDGGKMCFYIIFFRFASFIGMQ